MALIDTAFASLSELKLWYNNRAGIPATLADIQEIIPLRWPYFRDNWEFIVDSLRGRLATYTFPDILKSQIDDFTSFIRVQRNATNKKINPFSDKTILSDFYAIWENIPIASIPMTREESSIAEDKVRRIRRFIKNDFLRIRNDLQAARDEISDVIGLLDPNYNQTFGRSSVPQLRTVRLQDITNMQTLQQAIKSVDFLLANIGFLNTTSVDPFALARQNAKNPDINVQTGLSGQLVRMFFGDSLQSLSNRYFGDPDRWLEIAIANGLKPPYIDEIGEAIPLISNGSGNQINIAGLDGFGNQNVNKVFINQVVFLQSNTVKFPEQRTIINMREIPVSGEIVIELSGDPNLDQFQVSESAYMRVFKPNTTNSNFLILIPSPDPLPNASTKESPFFLASKGEDEKRAGIDLLLNDEQDLVFSSTGDFQLNYGIANAIQAMKIKMVSERGQLPRHPEYGLPPVIGVKANDPNEVKNALIAGINDLVDADARFDRIETLNVRVDSGSAIISMVVRLAGSGTLIPISFKVNTG